MLINIFETLGFGDRWEDLRYLDLGAHHPEHISNTKLLYDKGACGINVDASAKAIQAFNDQRPRDINLRYGVMPEAGVFVFSKYSETSGRNTFCAEEIESMRGILEVRETEQVRCVSLNDLLYMPALDGNWPHLLSVDIEGMDYAVLKSADFTADFGPLVICVEVREHARNEMFELLIPRGYCFLVQCGENMIFVSSSHYLKATLEAW